MNSRPIRSMGVLVLVGLLMASAGSVAAQTRTTQRPGTAVRPGTTARAAAKVRPDVAAQPGNAAQPNGAVQSGALQAQRKTLADCSWTYQVLPDPPEFHIHDLITIIVKDKSQVISEGEIDRRKKADVDIALKDWVLLDGFALIPDPFSKGEPTVKGRWNNKMKSEGSLETRDAMEFRITCRVVDIRPNGNLVIEGHRLMQNNNELWEKSLTGAIRPEDVMPDNTVLSDKVADLRIIKREAGHVRDSYRRGWLMRWLDTYEMF